MRNPTCAAFSARAIFYPSEGFGEGVSEREKMKLKIETADTSALLPYAHNAKEHPDWQIAQIVKSIEQFGFNDPVGVWTNESGQLEIVEGHGRVLAAKELGLDRVPIVKLDHLDDEGRRAYTHVHNQLNKNTGYDWSIIESEILDMPEFDWAAWSFPAFNYDEPLDRAKEVDIPEEVKQRVKLGDIWQIGEHRLMCGDSTDAKQVEKLMGGNCGACFTSPPYSDMRDYNGGKELGTQHLAKFLDAYKKHVDVFCVNLGLQRKDGAIFPYWNDYINAAEEYGLKMLAWNIWDKDEAGSIANQSYMFPCTHEFIFVFGKEKKETNVVLKKKTSGEPTTRNVRQKDGTLRRSTKGDTSNSLKKLGSVIRCIPLKGKERDLHPAQFPVALALSYIEAITDKGGVIVDPFGGAGTTMLAAEQSDRKAYLMELDPHYCDVIITRWENFTGKKAVKL